MIARSRSVIVRNQVVRLFTRHQLWVLKVGLANPKLSMFALMSLLLVWFFGPVLLVSVGIAALNWFMPAAMKDVLNLGPIPSVIAILLLMLMIVFLYVWFFRWYLVCVSLMRGRPVVAEEKVERLEERLRWLESVG